MAQANMQIQSSIDEFRSRTGENQDAHIRMAYHICSDVSTSAAIVMLSCIHMLVEASASSKFPPFFASNCRISLQVLHYPSFHGSNVSSGPDHQRKRQPSLSHGPYTSFHVMMKLVLFRCSTSMSRRRRGSNCASLT
jgi:hypothetical protein